MHAASDDSSAPRSGNKERAETNETSVSELANKNLPLLLALTSRRVAPEVAREELPGLFRHVDHGW